MIRSKFYRAMRARKLTCKALAETLNTSATTVSHWRKGNAFRITPALRKALDYLDLHEEDVLHPDILRARKAAYKAQNKLIFARIKKD